MAKIWPKTKKTSWITAPIGQMRLIHVHLDELYGYEGSVMGAKMGRAG